jgi:ubiquinone/menaquinone biosynthesis C-methylase UbiE
MDGPYPAKLHMWDGWTQSAVQEPPASTQGCPLPSLPPLPEVADRLYAREVLNPTAVRPPPDEGAEPYTLQWFLNIENQRLSRQGRWIPRLLEFAKHAGETLLGLGNGLGTDWLQYARHGAAVIVCSPSAELLALIRRNFELRSLCGRFLHADAASLPLESASIDVVCVSSLLQEVADPPAVIEEIYRVLKPGGKVLAVTPARYDIDFWFHCCFPWQRWFRGKAASLTKEVVRFSRWELHRLFGRFVEHRIHKRQLSRSEIPHVWRCVPRSLLERLMGRVLVLKAFKPLSAAMSDPLAA